MDGDDVPETKMRKLRAKGLIPVIPLPLLPASLRLAATAARDVHLLLLWGAGGGRAFPALG